MFRYRVRAIVLTAGIICAFTVGWSPVRAQEAEVEEAAVEEVQGEEQEVELPAGDPTAAITTKDTNIPVDELKLLVKPLTLEELNNEAAAWMEVLKRRAITISEAEIAVKRQNLSIEQKEAAAVELASAKEALEKAEEAQNKAEPGTSEYEKVTKQVEEAKDKLRNAEQAIAQAAAAQKKLQEDEGTQEALNKAQRQTDYTAAKETLERAEKERDDLEPGSAEYEEATKKIDRLKEAIKVYDETGAVTGKAIQGSPEYEEATKIFLEAYKDLNKAREAVDGVESTEEEPTEQSGEEEESTEQSSEALENTAALLDTTEIEVDGEEKIAGTPDVVDTEDNLEEKQEQLDEASDELKESAEAEADLKRNLVEVLTYMQTQQTIIIDRFKVVLDELDRKGGKSEAYRKYIDAISGLELDLTDTDSLGVRLIGWLQSEEGGMRWLFNLGKFVGIVAASIVVSNLLSQATLKLLLRYGDESQALRDFLVMLVKRGGIVIGVMLALTALEVSLGPVFALVGGISFVLAFALQSNLGNFASGLTLMLTNPFDVGDEVKVAGLWGYVDTITLASTKIKGWDAQVITVPNSMVWGGIIENLTAKEVRKGGVPVLVSFNNDLRRVKKILQEIGNSHPLILEDKPVGVYIYKGTEEFIWTGIKYWSKTEDYWTVYEDITFMIQERFEKEGIQVAMPQQQDLRIQYTPNDTNGKASQLLEQVPSKTFEPHNKSKHNSEETAGLDIDVDVEVPDF
ncbi:MAG: mechanosensitive ion channel [Symploca sp. SIO3E6]|nr:mechanosensitive ion channel [Caldora sp. SIO3E6]